APRWQRDARPVSYQTLHSALLRTEQAAGVEHLPYRGFHGGRRMAAENVYEGTGGDMLAAAAWINDRDVKQMKKYLKRRDQRMGKASEAANIASLSGLDHTWNHTRSEAVRLEGASEREPLVGIEPTTARLRIECSTPELQWRGSYDALARIRT